ncbi:MAG: hypothetical protein M3P18_12705 [Actinomycetota bacterium]|nr:hypothetical protein [Actinomycetota bacterium]
MGTGSRVRFHGEVALQGVTEAVARSVGEDLQALFAEEGGAVTCLPDRLVFDAYPPGATRQGEAREAAVAAVFDAFERHGVNWTQLTWTPYTAEILEAQAG